MRRFWSILPLCALVAIPVAVSAAQHGADVRARQVESQAVALESLLQGMVEPAEVRSVVDYGNGLRGISFPLDREDAATLAKIRVKDLQPLAHGHQVGEPSILSSLINSVSSNVVIRYKFWWVTVNVTSSDIDSLTKVIVKGPSGGQKARYNGTLTYPANTVQLYYLDPDEQLEVGGVYLHKVVLKGWGALKAWFWAE